MAEAATGIRGRLGDRHFLVAMVLATALAYGLGAAAIDQPISAEEPSSEDQWFSCSSELGTCADVMIRAIRMARTTIVVESQDLGPRSAVGALCSAKRRGVDVSLVQDRPVCLSGNPGAGRENASAQCDPNYKLDRPQTMVIDSRVIIRLFFSAPANSGAPRPVRHLLLVRNRISARAYLIVWDHRPRPLEPTLCGQHRPALQ